MRFHSENVGERDRRAGLGLHPRHLFIDRHASTTTS